MRVRNLAACALAAAGAAPAMAEQVIIEASKDNTLFEDPKGLLSNGMGPHMYIGRTNVELIRRGLIAFDVADAIPQYSFINSGMLTLHGSRTAGPAIVIDVHRVNADWGEGTSNSGTPGGGGAPATTGDATWIHNFYDSSLWQTAGGDFAATPSASASVTGIGAATWPSATGVVDDIQLWLDEPSNNFGWLLKAANEEPLGTAKRFDSRDHVSPVNQPSLTVDFVVGGDANHDDVVNLIDFNALAGHFNQKGATFEEGDFNLDGLVNLSDFNILVTNYGYGTSGPAGADWAALSSLIPEPQGVAIVLAGAGLLVRRVRGSIRGR